MSSNKIVYKGDIPESNRNPSSFPTPQQLNTLNEVYNENAYPQIHTIKSLSHQLQTSQANVANWFQSRREYERSTGNDSKFQSFELNALPNSLKYKFEGNGQGLEQSKHEVGMSKNVHNEFGNVAKFNRNSYPPPPTNFLPSPMSNLSQSITNGYDKPNHNQNFINNRTGLKMSPLEELKKDKTIPTDPLYYHLSDNRNFIEFNYGYIEPTSTPKSYINQKLALNTSKISIRNLDIPSS